MSIKLINHVLNDDSILRVILINRKQRFIRDITEDAILTCSLNISKLTLEYSVQLIIIFMFIPCKLLS